MIDNYKFGELTFNGKKYTEDLVISHGEVSKWDVADHHFPQKEDIAEILEGKPEYLIIGRSSSSSMEISEELREFIQDKGIKFLALPTAAAAQKYNQLWIEQKDVAAFLHLTC